MLDSGEGDIFGLRDYSTIKREDDEGERARKEGRKRKKGRERKGKGGRKKEEKERAHNTIGI